MHGLHIVDLAMGERVLVMGSGTIGLLSVLAAKAAGAGEVIATYRHEHQGRAALAAGADRVVKDGETGGLEKAGIDVVVETVGGAAPTLSQALGIVRPGGRISVLGLFTQPVQMNALGLMLKEVKMAGGITYCRPGQHSDFDMALGILQSQPGAGPRDHHAPLSAGAGRGGVRDGGGQEHRRDQGAGQPLACSPRRQEQWSRGTVERWIQLNS